MRRPTYKFLDMKMNDSVYEILFVGDGRKNNTKSKTKNDWKQGKNSPFLFYCKITMKAQGLEVLGGGEASWLCILREPS